MPNASSPTLPSWTVPTRLGAAWFGVRAWGHILLRAFANAVAPRVARHPADARPEHLPVLAEHRSPLWTDGHLDEFALVAGKVENLRIASRSFDGVNVPAEAVFSFWKQLGRPSRWRGFVAGREVRAGCVVPVVAGGLCQLSIALATCAARAGMGIVERHGHTARIAHGVDDDATVDATIFWNYIDLRIVAPFDWRLEVTMTSDELIVRVRAAHAAPRGRARAGAPREIAIAADRTANPLARSCLTCDETRCHRHPGDAVRPKTGTTAILVDAWTSEFARYLGERANDAEWLVPWVRRTRRSAGSWTPARLRATAILASWCRSWWLRRAAGEGGGRQAAVMRGQHALARDFARLLEPRHRHLILDQGLLLPLERLGALQGRTIEVLMAALPLGEVQRRLDLAVAAWPEVPSLRDFRAQVAELEVEVIALRRATRFATPHAAVAAHLRALYPAPVDQIAWEIPERMTGRAIPRAPSTPPVVVFPASALARKGAHGLAQALRHLGWKLLILGSPSTDSTLWDGISVEHIGYRDLAWLDRADVVALPAWIEHSPRALLLALAHGLPIVATSACGLPAAAQVLEVPNDHVDGLVAALLQAVASRSRTEETLTAP